MSHRVNIIVNVPEELGKGCRYSPNPKVAVNLLAHIASTTRHSMAVSRATRLRARVVHFEETSKQPRKVDVDDSEAAAVLSNFVLQCGETMPPSEESAAVETLTPHCRRSSCFLHLLGIPNESPPPTNASNKNNPTQNEVSLPLRFY